jgi:ATP-dependent RNA helicase DDX42
LDVLASKQQQQQQAANNNNNSAISNNKKLKSGLSLERTTMVVLDEADRMLQMGFSNQVSQILDSIRPDRQTLMLSATMSHRIEKVAQQWLQGSPATGQAGIGHGNGKNSNTYVRIAVGRTGQASLNVQQHVIVVPSNNAKLSWLQQMLPVLCPIGRTLVFCATKDGCEELATTLEQTGSHITCVTLHGDKHQSDRNAALKRFVKQSSSTAAVVMIATDVASRGLDIPQVTTVINYDPPKNLDIYTHRIGRAGRLSTKTDSVQEGTAYTLLRKNVAKDADMAHVLLGAMERDGRDGNDISQELRQLASQSRQQRGGGDAAHTNTQSRSRWNKAGLGAHHDNNKNKNNNNNIHSLGQSQSTGVGTGYYGPASAASSDQPSERKKSRFLGVVLILF